MTERATARVSEKGQVTIPRIVRERLGIRPGQVIEFEAENGRLVGRKSRLDDPVAAVTGILELEGSTDDFIDDMRGGPADAV